MIFFDDYSGRRICVDFDDQKVKQAYNLLYSDIYDFASKKKSLKKWEHKYLGRKTPLETYYGMFGRA